VWDYNSLHSEFDLIKNVNDEIEKLKDNMSEAGKNVSNEIEYGKNSLVK